jgi:hypothetical protein
MGIQTGIPFRESDSGPPRPFLVECRKADGTWRLFDSYATRHEAHAIAARLTSIGCPARVLSTSA